MRKTHRIATISEKNNKHIRIERRVYVDEKGVSFVMINGDFISLIELRMTGRKVDLRLD